MTTMELLLRSGKKPLSLFAWTVFVAAFVFLYSTWRRQAKILALKQRHECDDPPKYPHQDRIWGSDLARIRANAMKDGRLFKLYMSQFERYGKTFEEKWKGRTLINTIDPVNIKQITAIACDDYCKDPGRVKAQWPFLGPSIFSDGLLWKRSRALVKPAFSRAEVSDMDHLASFTDRFMELIPADGREVDMQPLLHRLVSSFRDV